MQPSVSENTYLLRCIDRKLDRMADILDLLNERTISMALDLTSLKQAVSDIGAAVTGEASEIAAVAAYVKTLDPAGVQQSDLDDLASKLESSVSALNTQGQSLATIVPATTGTAPAGDGATSGGTTADTTAPAANTTTAPAGQ